MNLAFGSMIWVAPDGSMSRGGYVVEDGTVRLADSADVVTWLEADGVSHRGGELMLTFGDDELRFVCRAIDGWLNEHHDVAWVDELCEVTHDGRTGYLAAPGDRDEIASRLTAHQCRAARDSISRGTSRRRSGSPARARAASPANLATMGGPPVEHRAQP